MQTFALGILAGLCLMVAMAFIAGAVHTVVAGYREARLVRRTWRHGWTWEVSDADRRARAEIAGGWLGAFMALLVALFWVAIGMLIGSAA